MNGNIEKQMNGDYSDILRNSEQPGFFHSNIDNVVNFMQGMEFKTPPNDYPKLFASRDIKKGELLFAEKPLAVHISGNSGYLP